MEKSQMIEFLYSISILSFYKVLVLFLGVFLLCCSYILIIYMLLYTWRAVKMTFMSYLSFLSNFIIFLLMGLSALVIILKPIPTIYLEDISLTSLYKYSILLIICFIVIIGITIRKVLLTQYNFESLKFWNFIYFPNLKEEIRLLLYTWNDAFIGNCCMRLLDFIIFKDKRIFYLIIHFILFNLLSFIQTIFLMNFVFFHGKLNYVLYLLPISFLIWCLRFIDYYFITFITQSGNYIRAVLHVELTSSGQKNTNATNVISCNISDLRCKLTDFGIQEDFTEQDLSYLANKWLQLNHITLALERYFKFTSYFKYLNLILRVFCWFGIVYICLISPMYTCLYPILTLVSRTPIYRTFHSSRVLYAQEARWVKAQHRVDVEKTFPGFKGDHPVVVDPALKDDNGYIPFYLQATHGSANNQSKEVSPNKDFQGNSRAQNGVFPKEKTTIKESWTSNTIHGSTQVLQEAKCIENVAKNSPHFYDNDE